MKCSEVMTRDPECCVASDTVQRVAQLMKSSDIGSVPVVEDQESKRLIGIITDRDLVLGVLAEGHDPMSARVADVMSRDMVTCREDDDLERALNLMEQAQVRRIPVLGEHGNIVGIIAQADIATRVPQPEKTAELVEEVSEPRRAAKRPTRRKTASKKKSAVSKRRVTKRRR